MMVAEIAEQPRTLARPKLTLGWKGKTERAPEFVEVAPEPEPSPAKVQRAPSPIIAPRAEYYSRVKDLLDRWAEWMATEGNIARGVPRQCIGAPDARIHSFEDMEIEVNKKVVRAVDAVVWALPVIEREAVLLNYGLRTVGAWRANFDQLFDQAIDSLYAVLKNRVAC